MPSSTEDYPSLSVVISTFNRTEDIGNALESILGQSLAPDEVLVVDDSDNEATEKAVSSLIGGFSKRGTSLRYLRNTGEKSLTVARNLGVDNTKSEVVLFIDDDVVLDGEYARNLLRVYADNPGAAGVQGFHGGDLTPSFSGHLGNAIDRVFMTWAYDRDSCRIMPSFSPTYPYSVSGVIDCQWQSGCNMSYRRRVFDSLRFDDKLRRYSPGEDLDFSYRVWRSGLGAMYMAPGARLEHRYTPSSRTPKRNLVVIKAAYMSYLFSKNMDPGVKSRLAFAWSNIGRMATSVMRRFKAQLAGNLDEPFFTELKRLLEARAICSRHKDELRSGNLTFLDEFFDY